MPQTVRFHRVIRAPAERIYRAFLEPAAMCKWLPPNGFTGTVHQMDAKVGGHWRMSFNAIATGDGHTFGGDYLELVPGEKLRYDAKFDVPLPPDRMTTTVLLRKVPAGTEVEITQEGIPDAIPADMCYLGWQDSLRLLASLVEGIPGA